MFPPLTDSTGNNTNYIVSFTTEPFTVFGAPYSSGCPGQAITVTSSGTLKSIVASISYSSVSRVHGLALSSDDRFIYSGDDMGNSVWAHYYNVTSSKMSKFQQRNITGKPRHLVVSPQGSYVYVMLDTGNAVGVLTRGLKTGRIAATNTTFSTISSGALLS
jgi:carboxy-cis,cis-muconate cyclase